MQRFLKIFLKILTSLYFPLNFLFVHSSFLPAVACLRMRYTTCIYQLQGNHISAQSTFCALISQYDPKSSGVEIDHTYEPTHTHTDTHRQGGPAANAFFHYLHKPNFP